jgi:hypothetical protein
MKLGWVRLFTMALAVVPALSAAAKSFDVRLMEPAEHAVVAAGSTVSIGWEAQNVPANVEEWEAFLSIDAGRTYPIRLTPHLDARIHRFPWHVPNLPGAEVTILLRFGDEHQERRFAFPSRARITGLSSGLAFLFEPPAFEAPRRGEAAAVGGEGVVGWVEGARDGSSLRQVFAREASLADQINLDVSNKDDIVPALAYSGGRDGLIVDAGSVCGGAFEHRDHPNGGVSSRRRVVDTLLISSRRNV